MARSFPDVQGTKEWQDVTALPTHAAIANQRVTVQPKSGKYNAVWFGGDNSPAAADGIRVPAGVGVSGSADHVWVRGDARFAVLVED